MLPLQREDLVMSEPEYWDDEPEDFEDSDLGYDYDGSPLVFKCAGSALRAAGPDNPRNLPCPTCGVANRLTPKDRALGYQCDSCADRTEYGGYGPGGY